jgi:hypothetical protein
MLWLGRWRLAMLFTMAVIAAFAALLFAARNLDGVVDLLSGTSINVIEKALLLAVSALAFAYALHLNPRSLERPWYSRWYVALPAWPIAGFAAALLVRTFFFQPFDIPSGSNYPNLVVGDYIFVSKTAYGTIRPSAAISRSSGCPPTPISITSSASLAFPESAFK